MFVHRRKLLPLYVAAALVSSHVAAVGLGELSLQSYLGKPLQAEVALSHMGDLSIDQLKVQIGSQSDYSALGVEYSYLHSRLKIEPFVKKGQNYVRISTSEPISEPYLDFVLNLRWPQGQVVREFTVLLDPAPTGSALASQQAVPLAAASTIVEQQPADAAVTVRPRERRAAAVQQTADGRYVTQRGDSLWRLAAKLKPSAAVSVEQMMAALLAANPDAFINGDTARLKESASIDVVAAQRLAVGGAPPAPTTAVASAATPAPSVPASTEPAADATMLSERTELAKENATLKSQVAELSENVGHLNENLAQSTDRLHEMEARLDNLLQQFQQQRTPSGAVTEFSAVAVIAQPGSMINQVNASELAPLPKVHTPWWVHLLYWSAIAAAAGWAVREHFWPTRRLAMAVGAVGDTGAALDYRVVERSAASTMPSDSSAWGSSEQYWQHPVNDASLSIDLSDALSESAHNAPDQDIELNLPSVSDDAIDVSISAGVFVAFGRFDEAERLLRAALVQDRERIDLQLQLLDVYLQSDQAEAFESLAHKIEQSPATPETLAEVAVLRDSYQARG